MVWMFVYIGPPGPPMSSELDSDGSQQMGCFMGTNTRSLWAV